MIDWSPIRHGVAVCAVVLALVSVPCVGGSNSALLAQGRGTEGSTASSPKDTVLFVHAGCPREGPECRVSYPLELRDGERFAVTIKNTRLDLFVYSVAGVPRQRPEGRPEAQTQSLSDTTFVVTHDDRFGGYIVSIRRMPGAGGNAGAPAADVLPEAVLVISVETDEWKFEVAGGFPISAGLQDQKFAVRDSLVGNEMQSLVIRDEDKEDNFRFHTATFVHIFRTNGSLAGTFGIGIGDETTYFVGPSYRFGSVGAVTLGLVFGPRAELPSGLSEGDELDDPNDLSNLGKKNSVGGFLAFSFGFLGADRSALEKPFQGSAEQAPAQQQQAAPVDGPEVASPADDSLAVSLTGGNLRAGDSVDLVLSVVPGQMSDFEGDAVVLQVSLSGAAPVELQGARRTDDGTQVIDDQGFSRTDDTFERTIRVDVGDDANAGEYTLTVCVDGDGIAASASVTLTITSDGAHPRR